MCKLEFFTGDEAVIFGLGHHHPIQILESGKNIVWRENVERNKVRNRSIKYISTYLCRSLESFNLD